MLLGVAGPGDSSPSPFHTYHILGSSRHTVYPHSLYLRHAGFSTIFSVFRPFSPIFAPFSVFLAPWPHAAHGTRSRNTETGAGRPRGAATPTQGGLWPPPHRAGPPARSAAAESAGGSRADRGQRDPGAERPPGGQPGRSGQRGSASTVEGTATRARRDRLPRTPGARAGRRGGRPAGRPPAKKGRAGNRRGRPHTAIAVGPALRGAEASRWVPPDQSAAPGAGEGPGGGPPAQTPQAAQRRPRAERRRD